MIHVQLQFLFGAGGLHDVDHVVLDGTVMVDEAEAGGGVDVGDVVAVVVILGQAEGCAEILAELEDVHFRVSQGCQGRQAQGSKYQQGDQSLHHDTPFVGILER